MAAPSTTSHFGLFVRTYELITYYKLIFIYTLLIFFFYMYTQYGLYFFNDYQELVWFSGKRLYCAY